jgi:hypothetical protein
MPNAPRLGPLGGGILSNFPKQQTTARDKKTPRAFPLYERDLCISITFVPNGYSRDVS